MFFSWGAFSGWRRVRQWTMRYRRRQTTGDAGPAPPPSLELEMGTVDSGLEVDLTAIAIRPISSDSE
jgi:hypothetical protein